MLRIKNPTLNKVTKKKESVFLTNSKFSKLLQSSKFYFLLVRVHLPNLDQKLVENQQSFQPVLRGLLDEGCFLVLLQIF